MKSQKKEIIWNLVNSALAGALVFLGALASGGVNSTSICTAIVASLAVLVTKFKSYWESEEGEYKSMLFNFVR